MLRDIIRLSDISEYYRYQRIRYFQKRIIYFKKLECHSVNKNYRSESGAWDGQKGGGKRGGQMNSQVVDFLFVLNLF